MTITENTLLLPGSPGFSHYIIGGGHRGSDPDPVIDAEAERLLRSSSCNQLDPRIISLLDSEIPDDRAMGVNLALLLLSDIKAQEKARAAKAQAAARDAEARRMADNWEVVETNRAMQAALPLFVALCLFFEFVSEEKQAEVLEVIEQFDSCSFGEAWAVRDWAHKAQKLLPYLERRQQLVLERRAKKAAREKNAPAAPAGVNWDRQATIPVASSSYVAERTQSGMPQRGVVKAKPRDGMGRAKR